MLETYGKKSFKIPQIFKKKSGYLMLKEKITLDKFDKSEEEQ